MAYIWFTEITTNSISVMLDDLDTEYTESGRTCAWSLDGVLKATRSISGGVTSAAPYTFSNLRADTKYTISAYITYNGGSKYLDDTVSTESLPVNLWYWDTSNVTASESETILAYEAITSHGALTDFSYNVWNDLVEKVLEILSWKSIEWDDKYASPENTLMTSSDKILTADKFNSLRYNVGSNYSTGISEVDTGDLVYGSYFTTLTTKINQWIES